jgi:hypothetical protein
MNETRIAYEKIIEQAKHYEIRYETINATRKRQFLSRIRDIMNKLRHETFDCLTKELMEFLQGHEQKFASQTIRIVNDEGRTIDGSFIPLLYY